MVRLQLAAVEDLCDVAGYQPALEELVGGIYLIEIALSDRAFCLKLLREVAGPCPIPFQPRQLLGQHTGMTEHQTAINFSRGMDAQGALTIWREGGGTIKLWTIHRSRLEVLLDDPWPTHQPWNSAALAGVCSSSGVESRNPLVDK